MAELKPCPFCGGKAKLTGQYGVGGIYAWAVYCGTKPSDFFCGAQVTSPKSEEAAIKAWNRRADNG